MRIKARHIIEDRVVSYTYDIVYIINIHKHFVHAVNEQMKIISIPIKKLEIIDEEFTSLEF